MTITATSLPFAEQSEFLRRKLNVPTRGWTDVYGPEHEYAFTVAGANRDALVQDFREAVEAAIDDGETLEQFRRRFDEIVTRHGWSYNGGRNWRSRVIYETNLRSSYMAGRHQQLLATTRFRPYWRYVHADWVEHPRQNHLAWNDLVLRWDDPWWRSHMPINAWGCQCSVESLDDEDLAEMGKSGPDTAPEIRYVDQVIGQRSPNGPRTVRVPEGIDPGFEHAPGASRLESAVPRPRPDDAAIPAPAPGLPNTVATDELPAPRPFPAERMLPPGLTDEQYVERYLEEFGASLEEPAIVRDAIGERLVIGREMFVDVRGELKANKRGRGRFLTLLAEALREPDEIWVRLEWLGGLGKAIVRRRYIARFMLEGEAEGESQPGLAVFEMGSDGWAGVTTFPPADDDYLQSVRQGIRLYRRPLSTNQTD